MTPYPSPYPSPDPSNTYRYVALMPDQWQVIAVALLLLVFGAGVLLAVKL